MFESTLRPKPASKYRHLLAVGSVLVHLALGAVFLALSFWEIQELQRPSKGVAMASSLALPPPGGGAAAKAEPKRVEPKASPKVVRESIQPNRADTAAPPDTRGEASGGSGDTGDGEGPGSGSGPGGLGTGLGIPLGDLCLEGSDLCAPPPVPVATEVEQPQNVPAAVLGELRRTAGDAQIHPPSATRNAMARAGKDRTTAIMLVCLGKSGAVSKARIIRSSGYEEYDAKLRTGVRRWRYEPYRANGIPAPICTQLTFVYKQE